MFCRQCGCELGEKDKFCFNCGTPVQPVDTAQVKKAPVEEPQEAPAEAFVEKMPEIGAGAEAAEPEMPAVPEGPEAPEAPAEAGAEKKMPEEAAPAPKKSTVSFMQRFSKKQAAKQEAEKASAEPAEEAEPETVKEAVEEKPAAEQEPMFESFVELGSEPGEVPGIADEAPASNVHEAFDWNVYTFPSDRPRKTEDVDFDWGITEGEYKRRPRADEREIAFAPEPEVKPEAVPAVPVPDAEPEEEPEITKEELFGGSVVSGITDDGEGLSKQAARIDRFYKEDKRIEEFQKLLDSEYEKFRAGRPLDQDSFAENVESIKERTADEGSKRFAGMFGGAAAGQDMEKTAIFHKVSGLEKTAQPEEPVQPGPAKAEATEETVQPEQPEVPAQPEIPVQPEEPVQDGPVKKEKKGGFFGFAARRAEKDQTLEMEKEEIQNALDSVFTTKTPEETISDIFSSPEEEKAREEVQEKLDRQIDDKTTEYDPAVLREQIRKSAEQTEAKAEEKAEAALEKADEAVENVKEDLAQAEEKIQEAVEKAGDKADEAAYRAEEKAAEVKEAAGDRAGIAAGTAEDKAEEAVEKAEAAYEKAEEAVEKVEKSSTGGTVAIVILSLILVALLVLLALKFFIPGFTAENTAVPKAAAMDKTEYSGDLNGVIQTQLDKNYGDAIEVIKYDSSWKAEGIDGTEKIKDNVWYKSKDGTIHYVDEAVVGTMIAYESQRQAMDRNGDLKVLDYIKEGTQLYADTEAVLSSSEYEPMKSLTFGKIKKAGDGVYCVWVREEKTDVTEKVFTLETDGKKMFVSSETVL